MLSNMMSLKNKTYKLILHAGSNLPHLASVPIFLSRCAIHHSRFRNLAFIFLPHDSQLDERTQTSEHTRRWKTQFRTAIFLRPQNLSEDRVHS